MAQAAHYLAPHVSAPSMHPLAPRHATPICAKL